MNATSENGRSWRLRFGALSLGMLAAGLVFGIAIAISEDLRLLYFSGAILLFCIALWVGAKVRKDWPSALLLFLPLPSVFGFVVLPQSPFLWPNLLLWAVASILGFLLRASGLKNKMTLAGVALLLAISAWYCTSYIPSQIKSALNRFGNDAAPPFTLQAISEGPVPTTATAGKILVIDFFATWCPPCIAELPELARVRADFQGRRDIEFVIAATNAGGDMPERVRSFALLRHITVPLAFDPGGKAHAAFGLSGFPGIVVIDRAGRVRLTHQGYNSSETSFRSDLTRLLESL